MCYWSVLSFRSARMKTTETAADRVSAAQASEGLWPAEY